MKALIHILCVAMAFCLCLSLLGCNNDKPSLHRSYPDASSAVSIEDSSETKASSETADSSETEDSSETGGSSIPSSSEHVIVSSYPPDDGVPPINSPDPSVYSSEESKDSVSSGNSSDSHSRSESSAETSSDLVSSEGNSSKTFSFESKYDPTKYPHEFVSKYDVVPPMCKYSDKHIINYPVPNGGKEIIVREGEYAEVSMTLKDPEKPAIQLMMEGVDDHKARIVMDFCFVLSDPDIAIAETNEDHTLDGVAWSGASLGSYDDLDRCKIRIYGNKKGSTTLYTRYSGIKLNHPGRICRHRYEEFKSDLITVTVI